MRNISTKDILLTSLEQSQGFDDPKSYRVAGDIALWLVQLHQQDAERPSSQPKALSDKTAEVISRWNQGRDAQLVELYQNDRKEGRLDDVRPVFVREVHLQVTRLVMALPDHPLNQE